MKKIITTALLIAITASGAMATSYKPGHSKHGYEQAYIQMSNVAEACGMLSPVPGGSGVCACNRVREPKDGCHENTHDL